MTISLVRCSPTIYSLEFAPEDKTAVKAAIAELFGIPSVSPSAFLATVRIDGEDFTFQEEWEDPCLITSTARGKEILDALAAKLGHTRV